MKQLISAVCMSCLLFAPVEAATIPEVLAHCRAKDKDAERLACYDELARAVAEGVALPTLSDSGTGQWVVHQEISPIDDSRNVFMALEAENMVDVSGLGLLGLTRPTLIVRCREGETNVYINYDWSLELFEDYITVLTRFDKQPAQKNRWGLSTDDEAIFAPGNVFWERKIAESQKLFVRITPTGKSPVDATFNLKGAAEAMRPLREACGW